MTRNSLSNNAVRYAITGVLAAGLLAGCAGTSQFARAGAAANRSDEARPTATRNRSVAKAEQAVERAPEDAGLRTALGHSYLDAGRFESAATSFRDALDLGDTGGRTALSLALATVGAGRSKDAVAILDQWRDSIPAADLGLALALAGETGRGVSILSDALRDGDTTAKLRQNLAYAYALDGRWREARVMAAQDVPADQLDARISDWAMNGKPEDFQKRVAHLLNVRVQQDDGVPMHLARNSAAPTAPVAELAQAPAGELPAVPEDNTGFSELPAVAAADNSAPVPAYESTPVTQQVAAADPAPAAPSFDTAFTGSASAARPASVAQSPARAVRARPAQSAQVIPASQTRGTAKNLADCTHLVQLGSFSNEARARRAWTTFVARNPELRGYQMTVTPAVVHGKNFWRVAAAGFTNVRAAAGLCSGVKNRGGACFAYAANRPPATGVPTRGAAGPMRARRR